MAICGINYKGELGDQWGFGWRSFVRCPGDRSVSGEKRSNIENRSMIATRGYSSGGCASFFVGVGSDVAVDCRRSFRGGGYESHVQCFDYGLVLNVLWSAWYYAFHVDVGDSFDVVVFVCDSVVVRGIVILLNFAFEGAMCREEFSNLLAYPGHAFFLVRGISVAQDLRRRL